MKIKNIIMAAGFSLCLAMALMVEAETTATGNNKEDVTEPSGYVPWRWEGDSSKQRVYKPDDPDNPIYLGSDGKLAGRGDPNKPVSEAYLIGLGQHADILNAAPYKDKFGLVDWVKMVDKKIVNPLGSLNGTEEAEPQMDMDIVISPKSDFIKDVVFSHNLHTFWLGCSACHDKLFIMAKGENKMTMKGISENKWCGACHGKVAFPLTDCMRCHSKTKIAVGR